MPQLEVNILRVSLFKLGRFTELVKLQEQLLATAPTTENWRDMFIYLNRAHPSDESQVGDYQTMIQLRLQDFVGLSSARYCLAMAELSMAYSRYGDGLEFLNKSLAQGLENTARITKLRQDTDAEVSKQVANLALLEQEAITSGNAESMASLGQVYLGYGKFDKAIELLSKALHKGGLKFRDETTINLGVAQLGLKNTPAALGTFKSIPEKSKSAHLARLWSIYAATL
jgi:tetratricopeptide (TPR) repeat protein